VKKMMGKRLEHAKELRGEGLPYRQIAINLGVGAEAVRCALVPAARERKRIYRQDHKQERKKSDVQYRKNHKQEIKEYREGRKQEIKLYCQEHRQEIKVYKARYRKEHQYQYTSYRTVRRALIAGATIGNLVEIKAIYQRAQEDPKGRCYLCGQKIPFGKRHVDHIIPLSKGGAHRPSNLAVACKECNRRKAAKMPEDIGLLL